MKLLIWSTVICIVSFTLSGVFYGYANFSGLSKDFKSGKYNWTYSSGNSIDGEEVNFGERLEVYKAEEVKRIEIESSFSEVSVESENTDKIEVRVEFLNEGVEETYNAVLNDGVLKIDTGEDSENKSLSSFFGNSKYGCKIEIAIPKGLELDYDFKLALGALDLENLKIGDFKAKLAAGNIKAEDVDFQSAIIKAAAGNIKMENIKVSKQMDINAAAGNVKIELAQADPVLDIKSAAGNIKLTFVSGVEPNLTFKSLSTVGELSIRKDFESMSDSTYVFGEGKGRINVKSTFGNVKFK